MLLVTLAALWAAVLVPATLRSREVHDVGRSIEGFHAAMRTLSRRAAPSDTRFIMVPTAPVTDGRRKADKARLARRRALFSRAAGLAGITLVLAVVASSAAVTWMHLAADVYLASVCVSLRREAVAEAVAVRAELRARRDAERRAIEERERFLAARARFERSRSRRPLPYGVTDDEYEVPIRRWATGS